MDKSEVFNVLDKTMLKGIRSSDYEEGFCDCYRQIKENFEKEADTNYKPGKTDNYGPSLIRGMYKGHNLYEVDRR